MVRPTCFIWEERALMESPPREAGAVTADLARRDSLMGAKVAIPELQEVLGAAQEEEALPRSCWVLIF
jgi:hypothetical protein